MKKLLLSAVLAVTAVTASFATGHTVTTSPTNVTCFGACDGTVTANVSGGVGPFTYSWSSGASGASLTSLCAGSYTVTVTDNSDMSTATATVVISQPALLTIGGMSGGSTVCSGGGCTTLTPIVSGGTPGYTFNWSGGLFGSGPTACPSSTTTYTLTVADANACIATGTTTVTVITSPTVTLSPTFSVCTGSCVTLAASTTPGPATYAWTGPSGYTATVAAPSVCPTSSATYTVVATYAGCTGTAITNVTVNALPLVTLSGPTVSCATDTSFFTAGGATTYSWSPGITPTGVNTGYSIPATSTTYTVTGSTGGCTNTATITDTVIGGIVVTLPSSYAVCFGSVICMSASAAGATTYSWSPATSLSSTTTPNPCAAPAVTTTYTVIVSNGSCTGTATTTVYVDGPITATISTTNTTDCTVCNGSATVTPAGGSAAYAYSWAPTASSAATANLLCVGNYTVTVTDINGCTATAITMINADNGADANFTIVPDSTDPYNFFMFNTSTGAGLSYDWSWGDATPNSTTASPSHYYPTIGTMNICLVVNSSVCADADTLCLPATVTGTSASCLALFNIADDTTTSDPNALYVYNLSYGSSLSYYWDFGDGTNSTLATPSHTYSGTGPYNLCLSVDNGAGCIDTYCDMLTQVDSLNRSAGLTIQVFDVPPFQGTSTGINSVQAIQNVTVSPNPFTDNTLFTITSTYAGSYDFEMTDVLGKQVRTLNNITEKQFVMSGEGLDKGIYFYKITGGSQFAAVGKLVIR